MRILDSLNVNFTEDLNRGDVKKIRIGNSTHLDNNEGNKKFINYLCQIREARSLDS